ncbi:ATP-binding protein [Oceaniglobus ichthyenteri]|uniref:ATP-binding protein n=1 Tax=Oceaniglobus ichthyenteri TaxID=2136177 RepID=UPI000D3B70C1|nr:ATP-binding protein [Oceaniglobus ichthyenteri]
MTFAWLKRYAPRSLYGRAALILLTPVIVIQLVVAIVFIQRHYEDVTEQMSRSVALELGYILRQIEISPTATAGLMQVAELAKALNLVITLPDESPPMGDKRRFYDLSGRVVIVTLRGDLPTLERTDLTGSDKHVHLYFETTAGPVRIDVPRFRVSASNPHQLLVLMAGVSLLMTVIAFLFLRNQMRPIRRLARAAEAFGRGRVVPYWPSGATEVRAAGQAFLNMRNRIERQIEQRTVLLSGVSHDLRTPLTRLKLGLSMMDEGPDTDELLGDVRDMEAMLASFLDFVQLDSLDDPEPVSPGDLIETLARGAQRAGQSLSVVGDLPNETVLLRPAAVRRALENLINNGVRYGTRVELSCILSERAVVFRVEDDGPGIDPAVRDEALKPFTRLDAARGQNRGGNVGLGLSIAMDIARQHGGTLRLDTSTRLGGLCADLVLAR